MNIDFDIESVIVEAVTKAVNPETLAPLIQKQVDSVVKSAIEEATGYRSEFRKLVEAKVSAAMPTDIEGFSRYGDLVLKVVAAHVANSQAAHISEVLIPRLGKALAPAPSTMKLSELAKMMCEEWQEDFGGKNERPTFLLDDGRYGSTRFYADPEEGKSNYSCKFAIAFRNEGDEIGRVWDMKINDEKFSDKMIIGCKFGIDAVLLSIYAGTTKLEVDTRDFSGIEYSEEYDD